MSQANKRRRLQRWERYCARYDRLGAGFGVPPPGLDRAREAATAQKMARAVRAVRVIARAMPGFVAAMQRVASWVAEALRRVGEAIGRFWQELAYRCRPRRSSLVLG